MSLVVSAESNTPINYEFWKKQSEHFLRRIQKQKAVASKEFSRFLEQALQQWQSAHSEDLEHTKAFIHAFQLYSFQHLQQLMRHYDSSVGFARVGSSGLRKSLTSLMAIPLLQSLIQEDEEAQLLMDYQIQLQDFLKTTLDCELETLWDKSSRKQSLEQVTLEARTSGQEQQFFEQRLQLLFSKGYQNYLILRNRYLAQHLLQCAEQPELDSWLRELLQLNTNPPLTLENYLPQLTFMQLDDLVQQTLQHFAKHPVLSNSLRSLRFEELAASSHEDDAEEHIVPPIVQLESVAASEAAHPQLPSVTAELDWQSTQAAQTPLQRDAFEALCFRYAKPLIYLANHLQVVKDCSSPYLRPKAEEYIHSLGEAFCSFFGKQPKLFEGFRQFVEALNPETEAENPFEVQYDHVPLFRTQNGECVEVGAQERARETPLLFMSRLPFAVYLNQKQRQTPIEKGRRFVLYLGQARFDADCPREEKQHTPLQAYFKLLIHGNQWSSESTVVYVGRESFHRLSMVQSLEWRALVLLSLIALRSTYSVELSSPLKDYLVHNLPPAIEELSIHEV